MFLSDETEKNKSVRTLLSADISSNGLSIRATNCVMFLEEITGTYCENNSNRRNTLCKKYKVFKYYSRWKFTCRNPHL